MLKAKSIDMFDVLRAIMLLFLSVLSIPAFATGESNLTHVSDKDSLTYGSGELVLSNDVITKGENAPGGYPVAELLFYPQFRFKNSRLDRFYLVQLNVNPALHLRLWKGAVATAQVIFPIHNEYSTDESKIRPGVLTLSQTLKLPVGIHMLSTVGNFTTQRVGGDIKLYRLVAPNAGVYAQSGLTYWTLPFFDRWIVSEDYKVNWRVGANYFLESSNLLFNANVSKNLGSDITLRGEVIRYFKNASVGFYLQTLQYEGYALNGGFFFAIELSPRNRSGKRKFIMAPSKDFSLEYVARPYSTRGVFYRTSPAENSSHNFFNNFLLGEQTFY